jgi:hypothetical protein
MRLNSINPKDNPMEEVLYCFGGDTDSGDAGDVESGKQGMGPAASGPQRDLGAKSDVADYSKDDSDRRVQSTGSTTNFNIDRSQPSVSTASGRVYGTQTNLDRAIASGDLDITPSAIDSYTPETEEARSAFIEAGGIMPRDPSAVDTSALDEIAYEFDTINVESEFYEDQILRNLRKEDYSAVFDQRINKAEEASTTLEPTTIDNVVAGAEALADRIQSGEALQNVKKGFDRLVDSLKERFDLGEEEAATAAEKVFTGFDGPTPTEIGFRDSDLGDALDTSLAVPKSEQNLGVLNNNPGNLRFAGQPGATEGFGGFAYFETMEQGREALEKQIALDASRTETLEEFIKGKPDADGVLRGGYAPASENPSDAYINYLSEQTGIRPDELITETDVDALSNAITRFETGSLGEDYFRNTITDFGPADQVAGVDTASLEASTQPTDTTTRTPEALQSLQEANARRKAELGLPEDATTEDIQKAINARRSRDADIVIEVPDSSSTVQRNPVMGFSPYEQLSTIDPETGERVALDFRTSLGGPDNFGKVDFGRLADPINVFGVDVPTGFGVAEGILNTFIDPTGTTERAVYEGGVRSVDGRATGLDTGIDLVTDGKQEVIGGYDRDRNIVYATEGNLFNPALSDFYEEKRRVDDASRDDGDEPRPLAGGLEILPQSTLSAYDFGSSSFDPFPTGTGTGTGSIDSLPAIGDPAFDFIRDFGAFTLSPRAAQAPIGTYSPEYLAPISELGEGERERLAGLLGTPLGAGLGLSSIDTAPSPIESAEALIKGLGSDQSV